MSFQPQSRPSGDLAGEPFIDVVGIDKRFGGVQALKGVSLRIMPGEIYHLLGENGCGKSTLIKIISGAQPPDSGEIVIAGQSYRALTPLQSLAAGIETVYQDLSLIPNMTVAENVALIEQLVATEGRMLRVFDRAQLQRTAEKALAAAGLPTDAAFRDTPVASLPIATRQLVAISRAIATQARLVIMDEPTTALTQREVDNLIRVVEGLRASGVAVLFVSHKLDECYAIGGQVIVLRDGEKVAQGPIADYTKVELVQLMTGKVLDGRRYRTEQPGEARVLRVEGLSREGAFSNVSFTLRRGEILGVTGLLDSGRNELALALAGVAPADGGELYLDEQRLYLKNPANAIAKGIGYVPEDRLSEGLFLDKSIRDNVLTGVLNRLKSRFGTLDTRRGTRLAE